MATREVALSFSVGIYGTVEEPNITISIHFLPCKDSRRTDPSVMSVGTSNRMKSMMLCASAAAYVGSGGQFQGANGKVVLVWGMVFLL